MKQLIIGKYLLLILIMFPTSIHSVKTAEPADAPIAIKTSGSVAAFSVAASVSVQWVARYAGPGNDSDETFDIALDTSGNVYVTGTSEGLGTGKDYVTIKYDAIGTELWAARYNGPGNGDDGAKAIAVDASGNVFVTGYSEISDSIRSEYATIKYNANGIEQWVDRYRLPAVFNISSAQAIAIALDSAENIYVTGTGRDPETDDYVTIKYDSDGNRLWVARYDSGDNDYASAITIDKNDNIYVTGFSWEVYYDIATVKYDSNGNEQWVARYNGPGNHDDRSNAIAVDTVGNVYVTGYACIINNPYNYKFQYAYATVKYDKDGDEKWVDLYYVDNYISTFDIAEDIALDSSGYIYVTGVSVGVDTSYDYATIKYDTDGNRIWVSRYDTNKEDHANAITIDSHDNIYVTGYSWGVYYDFATVKYDTNGNEQWVKKYNGPGNWYDYANAIAVDASGNVYVTGSSWGWQNNDDFATIKYENNTPLCTDNDNDTYSVEGGSCGLIDCDDSDLLINPGAIEGPSGSPTCTDTKDNDCDGAFDSADPDCSVANIINIPLNNAWNLLSLPFQPINTNTSSVLSSISANYTSVWSYDNGTWKFYAPNNPVSDLIDMEAGKGYWIDMTQADILKVTGNDPSKNVALISGWNLVGYNSSNSQSIENALASIDGKYISVWRFKNSAWEFYAPGNPVSDLTAMEPGYGYWINMSEQGAWTLP